MGLRPKPCQKPEVSGLPILMDCAAIHHDFIKTDTVNNFLVIYPYWWGDRAKIGGWANVYIEFDQGKNLLTTILDKRNIDTATKYFDSKDEDWAKFCYEKMYG